MTESKTTKDKSVDTHDTPNKPESALLKRSIIPTFGFIMYLFPVLGRYFYYTMQYTSFVYKKWHVIPCFLLNAGECVLFQNILNATTKIRNKTLAKVLKFIITSWLIVMQFFYMFIGIYDLVFEYGLMMRLAADVPYGYYVIKPPVLFNDTLPNEGKKFSSTIAKAFLLHTIEAQFTQSMFVFTWLGIVALMHITRMVQIIVAHCKHEQKPEKKISKEKQHWMNVVSISTVIIFLFYILRFNSDKFSDIAPAHWYFYRTSIRQPMPKSQYLDAVRWFRSKYVLPEGEDWLDQREYPVFPLIHAPKEICDAYNKQKPAPQIQTQPAQNLPNVVVLLWESWTPLPKYVDDEVLLNEKPVYQGQPYRKFYLPNIASLAEKGHTFLGVRSNGVPTAMAWLAFVSGEIANFKGMNMIKSAYNHMDDFPSKFRQLGYYSYINWPSGFNSDKKTNYVFRGREQLRGPPELKEIPLWFDEVHQFFPSEEEAKIMGIEEYAKTQSYWTNDRLCSQTFNYFFNQRVKDQTKPIFGYWGNVDTHEDFNGHDDDEQYEKFKVGVGRTDRWTVYGKHDAFSTVTRYADEQFGKIIKNLEKNAPNTIVVVVGDHASRQVPLYFDKDKPINEGSDIFFDMNCNNRSVGQDQQYTTSAVLAYLGQDERIKAMLSGLTNKTTFEASDHQDLIHTVFKMLEKLGAQKLPSSLMGVNIIDQAHALIEGRKTIKVPKLSPTHLNMEYSDENGLYRLNLYGPDDGYKVTKVLPSCIAGKNSITNNIEPGVYDDAYRMMKWVTFLTDHNRAYHYNFRNLTCVQTGTCQFPEPNAPYQSYIVFIMLRKITKLSIRLSLYYIIEIIIVKAVRYAFTAMKKHFKSIKAEDKKE